MSCKKKPIALVLSLIIPAATTLSQPSQNDIEALRRAAQAETIADESKETTGEGFTSGALGLQKLNPEISVTGDILWSYKDTQSGRPQQDFLLRGLGLHMEAYLDPFTRFKAAASFDSDDVHLGEAYMTRFGILPQVNLTIGKFRQQFGVVNRWHKHGLDQIDFPLALRQIFGNGGLNQTGISFDWSLPGLGGFSHDLTAQITDGENGRVFAENTDNAVSSLARYKLYHDLTDSTYAELGVSCLLGQNDTWITTSGSARKQQDVAVVGVDFTVLWEPTDRMRYRNITWRSEFYSLSKDIVMPHESGDDTINAWGAYTYLESKLSRTFTAGIRGDYFVPDTKEYADYLNVDGASCSLSPLAETEDGAYRWQLTPYVTWYQSPFVHFRMEYDHQDGDGTGGREDVMWLQCIFAAGPHKHERY